MKASFFKNRMVLAFLTTTLLAAGVGCTSEEKPEEEEVVAAEENSGEEAEAAAAEGDEAEVKQSEDVLQDSEESSEVENEPVTEPAPAEKAPVMPEAPEASAPEAVKAAPVVNNPDSAAKRTVWFVKADSITVHEKPSADAKSVGNMSKGDHFVGEANGEWAKISETRWVRTKDLSPKPVARKRVNKGWQQAAPSH